MKDKQTPPAEKAVERQELSLGEKKRLAQTRKRTARKHAVKLELRATLRDLYAVGADKESIAAVTAELERVSSEGASRTTPISICLQRWHPDGITTNAFETTPHRGLKNPIRSHVYNGAVRSSALLKRGGSGGRVIPRSSPGARRSRSRPRRPRSATQRSSAASGDSGSDDPEPEPAADGERVKRLCKACGKDISHRRRDAQTCGGKCRTKKYRKPAAKPRNTCRDRGDASNPVLDEVLATCGGWPDESRADRARLIQHAARLGITITDSQAGRLIDGCYRLSPREKLIKIAAEVREKQRADQEDELGGLVDLEAFRRQHERFVKDLSAAYSRLAVAA